MVHSFSLALEVGREDEEGLIFGNSHDCPVVGEEGLKEVEALLRERGVGGEEGVGGWEGGRVVLVDTSRPIGEWVPVAERVL